jgi:SPP1 family predicted phage head-tail adaptor
MTYRPGRGFRLGEMRHRITIKTETTLQDAAGQPVVSLVDWLVDEPAKYEPTQGGEGARGRQVEAGISAIFTVRYRDGYTPQMAIDFGRERFWVVYVKPVQGMDRYRELHCRSVVE